MTCTRPVRPPDRRPPPSGASDHAAHPLKADRGPPDRGSDRGPRQGLRRSRPPPLSGRAPLAAAGGGAPGARSPSRRPDQQGGLRGRALLPPEAPHARQASRTQTGRSTLRVPVRYRRAPAWRLPAAPPAAELAFQCGESGPQAGSCTLLEHVRPEDRGDTPPGMKPGVDGEPAEQRTRPMTRDWFQRLSIGLNFELPEDGHTDHAEQAYCAYPAYSSDQKRPQILLRRATFSARDRIRAHSRGTREGRGDWI